MMMIQMMIMPLIMISLMAMLASHPTSFIIIIMTQTLLIAMLTSTSQKSFWFGYTLFLVFLGGMLILFSYITSLASNTTFSLPIENMSIMMILMTTITVMIIILTPISPNTTTSEPSMNSHDIMNTLNKFYYQISPLTMMMILYLLITLLIVVNVTIIHKGPLRPQQS
uniref:NADH-ubiquinone oxidoreductase chain 6 n=1 Tax=Mecistocephalus marmoratus TaxID=980230 RepID=A0A4Y1KAH9_9MYRI|nr:NADH dehydrogenase subunit 6 [Mecistocephalus marmoratus]ARU77310.1 NADH dehydrogenase subunit 6 [Mecistocephalus marmoratus]